MSDGPNPSGLCMCGCGGRTNLAHADDPERGHVKGRPYRFIAGHQTRKSPVEYIEDEHGCWVWQRAISAAGYGTLRRNHKTLLAHRSYWERANGPIPDGMQLDHVCRNRACVNPSHLEPVSSAENCRRGTSAKISADEVREIRRLAKQGVTHRELGVLFGLSTSAAGHVVQGRTWAGVSS